MSEHTAFLTKDNVALIVTIFTDYMKEQGRAASINVDSLKRQVFTTMMEVQATAKPSMSLHQLNLAVLAGVRKLYAAPVPPLPTAPSMSRDHDLYGQRPVNVNELIPQSMPRKDRERDPVDMMQSFEDARRQREDRPELPDPAALRQTIKETPEAADDFMAKLNALSSQRDATEQQFRASLGPADRVFQALENIQTPEDRDPKVLYQPPAIGAAYPMNPEGGAAPAPDNDTVQSSREQLIIPRPIADEKTTAHIERFLCINSFDRTWWTSPLRYQYSVNIGGNSPSALQSNYRNVHSIQVGKVIIPDEIAENVNILNYPNKTQFNHEFSFAFPYILLRLEEFTDVYDGTNDTVRKSFCQLVYHRSYKAPNGRGYVVLKPIQKEKKTFHPTPLAGLNRLSLSLLRPNGQLLNDSSDVYRIFKVSYEPFNPNFLNIVTDVFFDKNEFYVGDTIVFQGYTIPANTPNTTAAAVKSIEDFINRPEGHDIVQIGQANENSFYRAFYIQAPGAFNRGQGRFDVDTVLTNGLTAYNNTINYVNRTETNGTMLNFSLQNSISLNVELLANDSGTFSTPSLI